MPMPIAVATAATCPVLEQEREDDLPRGHAHGLERADLADPGGHPSGHQHRGRRDREDGDQDPRGEQRAGDDVDVRVRVRAPFLPASRGRRSPTSSDPFGTPVDGRPRTRTHRPDRAAAAASSNPSTVMPRSRIRSAVRGVTHTCAGLDSGNRPRETVVATPSTGNGRPWIVTVSPASTPSVAARPPSRTTPSPRPEPATARDEGLVDGIAARLTDLGGQVLPSTRDVDGPVEVGPRP